MATATSMAHYAPQDVDKLPVNATPELDPSAINLDDWLATSQAEAEAEESFEGSIKTLYFDRDLAYVPFVILSQPVFSVEEGEYKDRKVAQCAISVIVYDEDGYAQLLPPATWKSGGGFVVNKLRRMSRTDRTGRVFTLFRDMKRDAYEVRAGDTYAFEITEGKNKGARYNYPLNLDRWSDRLPNPPQYQPGVMPTQLGLIDHEAAAKAADALPALDDQRAVIAAHKAAANKARTAPKSAPSGEVEEIEL